MQKGNTENDMQVSPSADKVLDRMRRLCSRREYCSSDIRAKVNAALSGQSRTCSGRNGRSCVPLEGMLEAAEIEKAAEEIMSSLVSDRYVDDLRYAAAFARDKSSLAGWGMTKIRYALSSKNIDKDTITAALEGIDDGRAAVRLEKLLWTKYSTLCRSSSGSCAGLHQEDDLNSVRWEIRQKLLRFALSRGYSYDDAAPVIEKLLKL